MQTKLIAKRLRRRRGEEGMTLIEVMIAGFILTVGLIGFAGLMVTAIAANARNRGDSTSTMLAQAVLEQVNAVATGTGTAVLRDCSNNAPNTINTGVGGAALVTSGALAGQIDWTESTPPAGYHMDFDVCADPTNTTANAQYRTYDVRWNVQVAGANTATYLITVGVRPKYYRNDQRFFALPVNVRAYAGP